MFDWITLNAINTVPVEEYSSGSCNVISHNAISSRIFATLYTVHNSPLH